ncbi:17329_t:CDS:2 [Entrophospora sp. SA101]|nr:10966_t:CDS:2 [Entrophospora sp. SA101]CAJ0645908.1 12893_t:CDS:2 [Entrophospora sp. SA101]CAJ0767966.1 17329_t:CDS:2 [Entrophospora sp. SA101]CAJ0833203.1 3000_t:CDS:2 [Entrophospora sp. SA101]CAJ0838725.1 6784_t:CDS:2 [Entrophospora sp. SA101]
MQNPRNSTPTITLSVELEDPNDPNDPENEKINNEKQTKATIELIERRVVVISILIPFSIIGALIRVKLTNWHSYQEAPVFSQIYPQFVGCVIMGFCLSRKNFIMERYLPLYFGLTIGLCGSITTFSSWILLTIKLLINYPNNYSNGQNVLASLAAIGITIGMSVSGLRFGEHLGDFILSSQRFKSTNLHKISTKPFNLKELSVIDWIIVGFSTFVRLWLSRYNRITKFFPIGTFAANILGSTILGILYLLGHGTISSNTGCDLISSGLADGFCGCLTTISTFAAEITTLPKKRAYAYALSSTITALVIVTLIVGSYNWKIGLSNTCEIF